MYTFQKECEAAKQKFEKAGMEAVLARLDHAYNYAKDTHAEEKKAEYVKARDDYRRLKQEFDNTISVPDCVERSGITLDSLKKATVRLPVDGKTSAIKVMHEMEQKLWKIKYAVPSGEYKPPLSEVFWMTE
jgi:hypothetical protein